LCQDSLEILLMGIVRDQIRSLATSSAAHISLTMSKPPFQNISRLTIDSYTAAASELGNDSRAADSLADNQQIDQPGLWKLRARPPGNHRGFDLGQIAFQILGKSL